MSQVRVLSCNLMNGAASPSALRRVIERERPDIVAAQELAPNAAVVLEELLPHGLLRPGTDYLGHGLALRWPAPVELFPLDGRNGLRVTLAADEWRLGADLDLLNVHFTNPIERPWRRSRWARQRQVATLLGHAARETGPVLVVGDLNATPAWPAYRRLIRVFRDGVHDTGRVRRTWAPQWWIPRLLRIDHALVRGGARVTAAHVVRIRGTDHSGLVVDVEVQ